MFEEVYITLTIMVGIGLLFGTILTVAYKKMKVYEDPRIDRVEEMLPSANCGACGVPGCRAFSEKVVNNEMNVGKCTVSSPSAIEKIADFLGIEANSEEKRVARLLCAGGIAEAQNMAEYRGGIQTCRGEAVVSGGPKECNWGCLGLGDCADVCDFNAIVMNDNGLPVVIPELCTACNDCVEVCPKGLFEIMPINQRLIVQCKSLLEGDEALSKCSVACNACNRCVADAQQDVISIQQNLAVINYELNERADDAATKRCPTGAIVWLNGEAQFENSTSNDLLPLGRVEVNLLNVN
ncbi:MAG: RnfABCDGE type electron transport complex subunit B [Cyclobacteriaceae bacterium]|nr:RnfABCDGE type electron transport complex subunit B [Cyclobacteriaceae bacterium]